VSAPLFAKDLLEPMKLIATHVIVSIAPLTITKSLPLVQLSREHQFLMRWAPAPILQDLPVLPRVVIDIKPEFDRVARPTVVFYQIFVAFFLFRPIFFELFLRVQYVENGGI
jgi:hypothetical protein